MARIPYPDLAKVPPERLKIIGYPERKPLNITHMALHIPDGVWHSHIALKIAMVNGTTIDPWLREVLILRTAWLANCEYELHHHISISANLGFTKEKQEALRTQNYETLTEEERTVAMLTDEAITRLTASDETLAKARALFGDAQVLEMIAIIGSYWATAMMAGVSGVEPDAEPIQSWSEKAAE